MEPLPGRSRALAWTVLVVCAGCFALFVAQYPFQAAMASYPGPLTGWRASFHFSYQHVPELAWGVVGSVVLLRGGVRIIALALVAGSAFLWVFVEQMWPTVRYHRHSAFHPREWMGDVQRSMACVLAVLLAWGLWKQARVSWSPARIMRGVGLATIVAPMIAYPIWRLAFRPQWVRPTAGTFSWQDLVWFLDSVGASRWELATLGAGTMVGAWVAERLLKGTKCGGRECETCGYSLVGLASSSCPECGMPFEHASRVLRRDREE